MMLTNHSGWTKKDIEESLVGEIRFWAIEAYKLYNKKNSSESDG